MAQPQLHPRPGMDVVCMTPEQAWSPEMKEPAAYWMEMQLSGQGNGGDGRYQRCIVFLSRPMTCSCLCKEGVAEDMDFIPSSTYLCWVTQHEISSLQALTLQPVKWVSHCPFRVDVGRVRAHL